MKKSVREHLNDDWRTNGGHATKQAILEKGATRLGSYHTYSDIEGLYMAVYSYWEHNVEDFDEVENEKWVGYEVRVDVDRSLWLLNNFGRESVRFIIPNWVMGIEAKDFRHAKNLFRKYLRLVR